MEIGNLHRTPSEDSGLLWWSSTVYGVGRHFYCFLKKSVGSGAPPAAPRKTPVSRAKGRRQMRFSVYRYDMWQNSNCNSLSVPMRLRQPCAALTHIFSFIRISSHLCSSSSSSRGRRGSYPSLLPSEHGRDTATVQLCPAVQTVCIKRACVVLSLTLERRTEGRCERQRERKREIKVCESRW